MQTSKWGPPTWRYLHTVAQNYDPLYATTTSANKKRYKQNYYDFFNSLQKVLPCKWCRISYGGFIKELPPNTFLTDFPPDLAFWIYQLHNRVNNKLRNQGLLKKRDPSFKSVYNKYVKILKQNNPDDMWYFLHTVAHNYDPTIHKPGDYQQFFHLVGEIMPYTPLKKRYQAKIRDIPVQYFLNSQEDLTKWLYQIRQETISTNAQKIPSYEAIYNKFEGIKATCKKSKVTNNPGTCQMPTTSDRCNALTKRGRQCVKKHSPGQNYCTQHQKNV